MVLKRQMNEENIFFTVLYALCTTIALYLVFSDYLVYGVHVTMTIMDIGVCAPFRHEWICVDVLLSYVINSVPYKLTLQSDTFGRKMEVGESILNWVSKTDKYHIIEGYDEGRPVVIMLYCMFMILFSMAHYETIQIRARKQLLQKQEDREANQEVGEQADLLL